MKGLAKFTALVRVSLDNVLMYRWNLIVWRVRNVFMVTINYFLWISIFSSGQGKLFGYNINQMSTYIILIILISAVVFASQTARIAEDINYGRLSEYLLKPVNYFAYIFSRDLADKLINISLSLVEFSLLFLIFRPGFIFPTPGNFVLFLVMLLISTILYFEITAILSMIGFWSWEIWAPRFIFTIFVTFLAGFYFPLDILPGFIFRILSLLPFTYLLYFPLKIYLGMHISAVLTGMMIALFWTVALFFAGRLLWRKGLRSYQAFGN